MLSEVSIFNVSNSKFEVREVQEYLCPIKDAEKLLPQIYNEKSIVPNFKDSDPLVPTIPWDRTKYSEGHDIILGTFNDFDDIEINRLSETTSRIKSLDDLTGSEDYQSLLTSFNSTISKLTNSKSSLEILGFLLSPPKFFTTTYDHARSCYLGLHIDNWDDYPREERRKGRQRVIANIAPEPRVFLFSEWPVDEMDLNWFEDGVPTDFLHEKGIKSLGRIFYVIIPSRGFCISPTENLIHDGSTIYGTHPGLALTALLNVEASAVEQFLESNS